MTVIPMLQARTLEAQRGQVTCQWPHSYHAVPPGSKPEAVQQAMWPGTWELPVPDICGHGGLPMAL